MLIRLLMVVFTNSLIGTQGVTDVQRCYDNRSCTYVNSFCNTNVQRCDCLPSHPVLLKNEFTLLCVISSKIGEPCEFSRSCHHYDPNTICNQKKVCKCKEGFRARKRIDNWLFCQSIESIYLGPEPAAVADFSDEDDDDDDSSEEEDDIRRSYEHDFVVPVVIGIVLGTLIVCAWSFAICRLYLQKVERQGRARRKRVLNRLRYMDKSSGARQESDPSRIPPHFSPSYSLVPSTVEQQVAIVNRNEPCDLSFDVNNPDEYSLSRSPSPLQSAMPLFSPDEEPLPGYDTSPSKESICLEVPPSYQEVMNSEEYEADHRV